MIGFADRLAAAVRRCGNGVMVGLDPRLEQLPAAVLRGCLPERDGAWTVDEVVRDRKLLDGAAAAYREFCVQIIDVVAPLVPIVKPQAAFFEELGPPGMTVLGDVIRHARERGLLVVLDAKRGDIGTTATAYARGILGTPDESPWAADAVTVNPYLGDDSLTPFVDVARQRGCGVFVLVKTSNPGGRMLQDLTTPDGRTIYQHVAALVESLAATTAGECGYGAVGAVVGATYPAQLVELRRAMPHAWLLVPGYGSQGGQAADVAPAFDRQGLGAVINNSRGLIFAHTQPPYRDQFPGDQWPQATRAATERMIADLRAAGV